MASSHAYFPLTSSSCTPNTSWKRRERNICSNIIKKGALKNNKKPHNSMFFFLQNLMRCFNAAIACFWKSSRSNLKKISINIVNQNQKKGFSDQIWTPTLLMERAGVGGVLDWTTRKIKERKRKMIETAASIAFRNK